MSALESIAYTSNTFPKAFLVWGVLDLQGQDPSQMMEEVRRSFPEIAGYSFINPQGFKQYMEGSMSAIVDEQDGQYSLRDLKLPGYAGFVLQRSVTHDTNPEYFFSATRNAFEEANTRTVNLMLLLKDHGKMQVLDIADALSIDEAVAARHVRTLADGALAAYSVPTNSWLGYEWVEGKSGKELAEILSEQGRYHNTKNALELVGQAVCLRGSVELTDLEADIDRHPEVIQRAARQLTNMGFLQRYSTRRYGWGELTDKGKLVVDEIIQPLIEAIHAGAPLSADPTIEQLVRAMDVYKERLKSSL